MFPGLTDRENEILKLIADGLTNREISLNLSISVSTVENHVHRIYEKLGISNRAQAVAYAHRTSIIFEQGGLLEIGANIPKIKMTTSNTIVCN